MKFLNAAFVLLYSIEAFASPKIDCDLKVEVSKVLQEGSLIHIYVENVESRGETSACDFDVKTITLPGDSIDVSSFEKSKIHLFNYRAGGSRHAGGYELWTHLAAVQCPQDVALEVAGAKASLIYLYFLDNDEVPRVRETKLVLPEQEDDQAFHFLTHFEGITSKAGDADINVKIDKVTCKPSHTEILNVE